MLKKHILSVLVLFGILFSVNGEQIVITEEAMEEGRFSIAEYAEIIEDASGELTIEEAIHSTDYELIGKPNLNLDFTTSSYWVKFSLKSDLKQEGDFLLEVARPLTNGADLYRVEHGQVVQKVLHGDDIPFASRPVENRKMLHNIMLRPNETVQYYLHLRSDGEVVTLPMVLWDHKAFMKFDSDEQFILGGYYGTLMFVVVIYFFFFLALKDKSFLYYVLYVLSLVFFQLALDGWAFRYLWPDNVWLGNHAIILFAGTTVFLVNMYAKTYLKSSELLPLCDKIFKFFLVLSVLVVLLGLTKGKLYAISFPLANGMALLSTLFILVAIIVSMRKYGNVNPYFLMAFLFLIIGSFLFILTNFSVIPKNIFTENSIKFGSALEVIFLSITMAGKYEEAQREKEEAQAEALEKLEEINKMREEANVKLERQVKERTLEIEQQKEEIEEKNKDILGSIHYSQRIQNAILPASKLIKEHLPDSFVLYKPKDIVSGDFYWMANTTVSETNEKAILFCAADCTGHGVPGAFMSLIGNNYLKLSLNQKDINSPAEALNFLNRGVNSTLKQNDSETLKDGMDIALCAWLKDSNKLYYAGAKNPLYLIRDGELIEIKGDKHPVGAYVGEELQPFTNHEIELKGGECIYIFSDGFPDQFGGPKGKKFMYGKFKKLLVSIHQKPMEEQQKILWDTFLEWKGNLEQIDDICIIGVRV